MVFENQCLVIKIGSTLLVDEQSKQINSVWLQSLVDDVVRLKARGCKVVIVSSGSVALGCQLLGFQRRQLTIDKQQAAAAVGQIHLTQSYQSLLQAQNLVAAQVLVSLGDSEDRKRFLNARNTLLTLLKLNVVPIVNENDTVATAEIRYGDNDRLAARVAQMINADSLILLSDIDGFYDSDPNVNHNAKLIPDISELTSDILGMAHESNSNFGSGGMITKLAAAKIMMASGGNVLITAGKHMNPITHYSKQKKGTWFHAHESKLSAKKAWLKEHLKPCGNIVVDEGAESAIMRGKSLLPVGIIGSQGKFDKGDAVSIFSSKGDELARGLSNYAFDEVEKIKGYTSCALANRLGYEGIHEVIHCDNLVRIG